MTREYYLPCAECGTETLTMEDDLLHNIEGADLCKDCLIAFMCSNCPCYTAGHCYDDCEYREAS